MNDQYCTTSKPGLLLAVLCAGWAFASSEPRADVRLPQIIDDRMVIQRDVPVRIWGWAESGESVSVSLDEGPSATTVAGASGEWMVELPSQKADGKIRRLRVVGNNSIELDNILVGDVWLGSGQSNMRWPLSETEDLSEVVANTSIRLFRVPKRKAKAPSADIETKLFADEDWEISDRGSALRFSALLYHFGVRLNHELGVPIGLIDSAWSGSPIEQWLPDTGLMYNGMTAPLQPLPLRGVLWYQGEANVRRKDGFSYFRKMKSLIAGWRREWGDQFPFYFVQLAPLARPEYGPGQLPALWEAQTAALTIPKTGMVVTTDLVEDLQDEHPQNKREVADRLALWALARTYGRQDLVFSGPLYRSMEVEGDVVRVHFAHSVGGLRSKDGKPLSFFEIGGADGEYRPAQAQVDGSTVLVWADGISRPVRVRFGWKNTATPNLVNDAGLPAAPFRSPGWRGGTAE